MTRRYQVSFTVFRGYECEEEKRLNEVEHFTEEESGESEPEEASDEVNCEADSR